MTSQPVERPDGALQMAVRAQAARERLRALRELVTQAGAERMAELAAEDPTLTPMQLVTEALTPHGAPSPLLEERHDAMYAVTIAFTLCPSDSLLAFNEREWDRDEQATARESQR